MRLFCKKNLRRDAAGKSERERERAGEGEVWPPVSPRHATIHHTCCSQVVQQQQKQEEQEEEQEEQQEEQEDY